MKKISLIILAALLCCAVMPSCVQQSETSFDPSHLLAGDFTNVTSADRSDDITDQSSVESSDDMSDDSSSYTESSPAESIEPEIPDYFYNDLDRYYRDDLYDVTILEELVSWDEIYAADKIFSENEYFYNEQVPPIYCMLHELKISKEDFIRVNEEAKRKNEEINTEKSVYTDKEIEYFYGNYSYEEIQAALKLDTVFQYKDRIYTMQDLSLLESSKLKEMAGDDLNDYLDLMDEVIEFRGYEHKKEYLDTIRKKIK